jgi:hypothetical protein
VVPHPASPALNEDSYASVPTAATSVTRPPSPDAAGG